MTPFEFNLLFKEYSAFATNFKKEVSFREYLEILGKGIRKDHLHKDSARQKKERKETRIPTHGEKGKLISTRTFSSSQRLADKNAPKEDMQCIGSKRKMEVARNEL